MQSLQQFINRKPISKSSRFIATIHPVNCKEIWRNYYLHPIRPSGFPFGE